MEQASLRRAASPVEVVRVRGAERAPRRDRLAGEEPMEIRLAGPGQEPVAVAVTMRTPGGDFELAAGHVVTEGLVAATAIARVAYCDEPRGERVYNTVTVRVREPVALGGRRAARSTSACGVCGKASLDEVRVRCAAVAPGPRVAREVLMALPGALRAAQPVFAATGGLHAAGLFDADGALLRLREDVGRHNAVDKVVGSAALAGELPLSGRILLVSGRAGFEIVQKAAVAGVPIVASVSAPSSLAARAAAELGMTLIGFLRDDGFNVYSAPERVVLG